MRIESQKVIARNLRLLRTKCAVSQVRMAVDLGLDRMTYNSFEMGYTAPDAEILYRISIRYGIRMNYFFLENPEDFLTAIAGRYYYDDSLALIAESYEKLSNFARGMLLEKTLQLLEQDKIIKANRAALEERKPKKPSEKNK